MIMIIVHRKVSRLLQDTMGNVQSSCLKLILFIRKQTKQSNPFNLQKILTIKNHLQVNICIQLQPLLKLYYFFILR